MLTARKLLQSRCTEYWAILDFILVLLWCEQLLAEKHAGLRGNFEVGAGEGNRTLVSSLENVSPDEWLLSNFSTTIENHIGIQRPNFAPVPRFHCLSIALSRCYLSTTPRLVSFQLY